MITRRTALQASAAAVAGSALTRTSASAASSATGAAGVLRLPAPRLNAGTGGSPLTPTVLRALATPAVPVAHPAFVDLFTRATKLTAEVLDTRNDVLLIPGEAILALEAAFRSVTRPGLKALNVISGLYGDDYTNWLKAYGAKVTELRVPFNASVDPAAVEAALDRDPEIKLLSVVHVDTPSGTANPIDRICQIARRRGVVSIVDAAATLGGMPLYPDRWGADITIGAAHKSIGSPVGFGVTSVSPAAWKLIEANPDPPEGFSFLGLEGWRETWIKDGRVPSTVSPTLTYGLYAALERLLRQGVEDAFAQTARAARAFRAGAQAAGIALWAAEGALLSETNTTIVLPKGVAVQAGLDGLRRRHGIAAAGTEFDGALKGQTIRVGHMGPVQTSPRFVVQLLDGVARTWRELGGSTVDVAAGRRAAQRELAA